MQRIGFIVLPLSDAEREFALGLRARKLGDRRAVYDVHLLSETGGSIRSSVGIGVATERSTTEIRHPDGRGSVVAGALTQR